jgi:hypothetical protein
MNKRTSATARILAVLALIAALVLVVVVIGGALGGDSDGSGGRGGGDRANRSEPKRRVPATYEIKSGDTLLAIAHRTDVPVARIEMLNPQVDPQILIAGETLKLR